MMITGISAREPLDSGPVNAFQEEGFWAMVKLSKWGRSVMPNTLDKSKPSKNTFCQFTPSQIEPVTMSLTFQHSF